MEIGLSRCKAIKGGKILTTLTVNRGYHIIPDRVLRVKGVI